MANCENAPFYRIVIGIRLMTEAGSRVISHANARISLGMLGCADYAAIACVRRAPQAARVLDAIHASSKSGC